MTLFARPTLEDFQFKQPTGATLTLCGFNKIKNVSGLTLSNGASDDVIVTASGASTASTQNYVLTYVDGIISLQPSAVSGGTLPFDGNRCVTRFADNPQYNVNVSATTVNEFLENYFFPAVFPTSSLSATNNNREFGDTSSGNLSYSVIRKTHQLCLVEIDTTGDGSYNATKVSSPVSGDVCGITGYTFPNACANPTSQITSANISYHLHGKTTENEDTTSLASVTWKNKKFSLKSGTLYNDGTISSIMSGGELSTSIAKTLTLSFSNEFFYYIYPKIFGTPSFKVNGLPNNAWGNLSTGTLYEFSYTNSQGYISDYYVARSDNKITGTYSIEIT